MTIYVLEHLRTQTGEPDLTIREILISRNFARIVVLEDEKESGNPRPPYPRSATPPVSVVTQEDKR